MADPHNGGLHSQSGSAFEQRYLPELNEDAMFHTGFERHAGLSSMELRLKNNAGVLSYQ